MRLAIVAFSSLLVASMALAQTTPSGKQSASTVAGQVVQDPGGMPLKKVVVSLVPMQGGDATQQQYSTVTDAEGHFQINGVEAGDYRVTLERNGFVATNHRSRTYSSASLSVAAGEEITGLLFRMLPAGVIQGRVLDEDGEPVPGAVVVAFSAMSSSPPANDRTNDLGDYRIAGLTGGEYFVVAETDRNPILTAHKPDEQRVYASTFYPGTVDRTQATKIEVHPGDEASANFNLVSTRIFTVRGSVSGVADLKSANSSQSGTPTVTLEAPGGWMTSHFEGPVLPNGTFEITGVPPGSYRASISAPSGAVWQVLRASTTVEVRAADADGIQLSPEPPSEVRGRFRMDTNDRPNPDWRQLNVQIDPDEHDGSNGPIIANVAKDGSFNTRLPSGNYHVVITSNTNVDGWRDFIVKEVLLNGKDVGDSGFSIAGGMTSLEIVASAQGSSIEGNVVDEDGKPVAGVPVVCIPDVSRRKRRDIYQQVQSDRQGHFALRGLNPGEYEIFTLDDPAGDVTDPDFVTAHEVLGQTVKLDPGERKGVVLKLPAESKP